jgi:hypothetical protein
MLARLSAELADLAAMNPNGIMAWPHLAAAPGFLRSDATRLGEHVTWVALHGALLAAIERIRAADPAALEAERALFANRPILEALGLA